MPKPLAGTYYAFRFTEKSSFVNILESIDTLSTDALLTVFAMFNSRTGRWSTWTIEGLRAISLDFSDRGIWLVGQRGEAWRGEKGVIVERHQLPDSGLTGRMLGQPNQVKNIAGRMYVCGFAGQVYELRDGSWRHIDHGLVEPQAKVSSIDLESIDGTSETDLYVVGKKGLIAHWDGHAWTLIPALTNVYLARVRCYAKDKIVVVGNKGVFIESDGKHWRIEQIPGCEEVDLWDVAAFNGDLYVTTVKDIYRRRSSRWEKVRHGFPEDPKTDFMRLDVGVGRLWVMGSRRLFSFDGNTWQAHPDPDNG